MPATFDLDVEVGAADTKVVEETMGGCFLIFRLLDGFEYAVVELKVSLVQEAGN